MPPNSQPSHSRPRVTVLPHAYTAAGSSSALEKNARIADTAASTTNTTAPRYGCPAISGSAAESTLWRAPYTESIDNKRAADVQISTTTTARLQLRTLGVRVAAALGCVITIQS